MLRAEYHVVELRLAGRNRHAFTVFEHILQLVRESEFVEQRVHLFVSSFHTAGALPKRPSVCLLQGLITIYAIRPIVVHL